MIYVLNYNLVLNILTLKITKSWYKKDREKT